MVLASTMTLAVGITEAVNLLLKPQKKILLWAVPAMAAVQMSSLSLHFI